MRPTVAAFVLLLASVATADAASLRYSTSFPVPTGPFTPDASTAALYHFDEGSGTGLGDATSGDSDGVIFVGGSAPAGPVWSSETPFPASSLPALGGIALAVLSFSIVGAGAWLRGH